jgi:hypothetical protein
MGNPGEFWGMVSRYLVVKEHPSICRRRCARRIGLAQLVLVKCGGRSGIEEKKIFGGGILFLARCAF